MIFALVARHSLVENWPMAFVARYVADIKVRQRVSVLARAQTQARSARIEVAYLAVVRRDLVSRLLSAHVAVPIVMPVHGRGCVDMGLQGVATET